MKKIKILKRHFDRAVAQPWSPRTCILAQVQMETGVDQYDIANRSYDAFAVREIFDDSAERPEWNREANWPELLNIREFLPLTVEIPD